MEAKLHVQLTQSRNQRLSLPPIIIINECHYATGADNTTSGVVVRAGNW